MRRKESIVVLIILVILYMAARYDNSIAFASQEDTDTETSIVTLIISPTCLLVITNPDASLTLSQDGTSEDAFTAGYVEFQPGNPTLKVFANKSWKLTARSSGFTGPYAKDIGDLQLRDNGSKHVTMGTYTSLSEADQEVASFTAGISNENHPCQYKILLDWTKDKPGTYTATVTYTLTTNAQ